MALHCLIMFYVVFADICNLQADVGPCKQYIRRWHYNSVSQVCEEFTYGGCLGNHNNFESKLQCMTYCDSQNTRVQPERPVTTEAPIEPEGSGELPTTLPSTGVGQYNLLVLSPHQINSRLQYFSSATIFKSLNAAQSCWKCCLSVNQLGSGWDAELLGVSSGSKLFAYGNKVVHGRLRVNIV